MKILCAPQEIGRKNWRLIFPIFFCVLIIMTLACNYLPFIYHLFCEWNKYLIFSIIWKYALTDTSFKQNLHLLHSSWVMYFQHLYRYIIISIYLTRIKSFNYVNITIFKLIEETLASATYLWQSGILQSLSNGIHCDVNSLLKMFANLKLRNKWYLFIIFLIWTNMFYH